MELNLSNKLIEALNFTSYDSDSATDAQRAAVQETERIDASHNRITHVHSLSVFTSLTHLNLSHNCLGRRTSEAEPDSNNNNSNNNSNNNGGGGCDALLGAFPETLIYLNLSHNFLKLEHLIVQDQGGFYADADASFIEPSVLSSDYYPHLLELDLSGNLLAEEDFGEYQQQQQQRKSDGQGIDEDDGSDDDGGEDRRNWPVLPTIMFPVTLRSLHLGHNRSIKRRLDRFLWGLEELAELDVECNNIDALGTLRAVASVCPRLEMLSLAGNPILDAYVPIGPFNSEGQRATEGRYSSHDSSILSTGSSASASSPSSQRRGRRRRQDNNNQGDDDQAEGSATTVSRELVSIFPSLHTIDGVALAEQQHPQQQEGSKTAASSSPRGSLASFPSVSPDRAAVRHSEKTDYDDLEDDDDSERRDEEEGDCEDLTGTQTFPDEDDEALRRCGGNVGHPARAAARVVPAYELRRDLSGEEDVEGDDDDDAEEEEEDKMYASSSRKLKSDIKNAFRHSTSSTNDPSFYTHLLSSSNNKTNGGGGDGGGTRCGERIRSLAQRALQLEDAIAETSAENRSLRELNVTLSHKLSENRRWIATQMKEMSALKKESTALDGNAKHLRMLSQKKTAEVDHAIGASERISRKLTDSFLDHSTRSSSSRRQNDTIGRSVLPFSGSKKRYEQEAYGSRNPNKRNQSLQSYRERTAGYQQQPKHRVVNNTVDAATRRAHSLHVFSKSGWDSPSQIKATTSPDGNTNNQFFSSPPSSYYRPDELQTTPRSAFMSRATKRIVRSAKDAVTTSAHIHASVSPSSFVNDHHNSTTGSSQSALRRSRVNSYHDPTLSPGGDVSSVGEQREHRWTLQQQQQQQEQEGNSSSLHQRNNKYPQQRQPQRYPLRSETSPTHQQQQQPRQSVPLLPPPSGKAPKEVRLNNSMLRRWQHTQERLEKRRREKQALVAQVLQNFDGRFAPEEANGSEGRFVDHRVVSEDHQPQPIGRDAAAHLLMPFIEVAGTTAAGETEQRYSTPLRSSRNSRRQQTPPSSAKKDRTNAHADDNWKQIERVYSPDNNNCIINNSKLKSPRLQEERGAAAAAAGGSSSNSPNPYYGNHNYTNEAVGASSILPNLTTTTTTSSQHHTAAAPLPPSSSMVTGSSMLTHGPRRGGKQNDDDGDDDNNGEFHHHSFRVVEADPVEDKQARIRRSVHDQLHSQHSRYASQHAPRHELASHHNATASSALLGGNSDDSCCYDNDDKQNYRLVALGAPDVGSSTTVGRPSTTRPATRMDDPAAASFVSFSGGVLRDASRAHTNAASYSGCSSSASRHQHGGGGGGIGGGGHTVLISDVPVSLDRPSLV